MIVFSSVFLTALYDHVFSFFSLYNQFIIDLHFLIPAVNAKVSHPAEELAIPTETPSNEAKGEIKTATDSKNKINKMLEVI